MDPAPMFWMLMMIVTPTNSGGPSIERFELEAECIAAGEALSAALDDFDQFLFEEKSQWICVPVRLPS